MRSTKEFVEDSAMRKELLKTTAATIAHSQGSSGDDALLCPRCGSNNLHHGRVTVYDRGEDAPLTAVSVIDGCEIFHTERESIRCANPSARRHGLAILFTCEGCGVWSELTIEQHKGETYLHWREPAVVS